MSEVKKNPNFSISIRFLDGTCLPTKNFYVKTDADEEVACKDMEAHVFAKKVHASANNFDFVYIRTIECELTNTSTKNIFYFSGATAKTYKIDDLTLSKKFLSWRKHLWKNFNFSSQIFFSETCTNEALIEMVEDHVNLMIKKLRRKVKIRRLKLK